MILEKINCKIDGYDEITQKYTYDDEIIYGFCVIPSGEEKYLRHGMISSMKVVFGVIPELEITFQLGHGVVENLLLGKYTTEPVDLFKTVSIHFISDEQYRTAKKIIDLFVDLLRPEMDEIYV